MVNSKQWQNIKRDEYYTPTYLVQPIIKYIPKKSIIWCPFDTEKSEYVKELRKVGHEVIATHIFTGQDFFKYEPKKYDFIISNPPFSRKKEVLERLYTLKKPFAILLGLPSLAYKEIQDIFRINNNDVQFLFLNRRATFDGNTSSFNSSYFCRLFLPQSLIFEELNILFEPSEMNEDRDEILDFMKGD